jgi:arabinofuranosyltransferase
VPLDGLVVDVWGLSNTVGAHITQTTPGAAGHEKLLPPAWNIALYVDPAGDRLVPPVVAAPGDIRAARAALQCGDLKELVDSVSAPLTAGRFWKNVTGSVSRTQLRIPANPVEAEQKFCGPGH